MTLLMHLVNIFSPIPKATHSGRFEVYLGKENWTDELIIFRV